MLGKTCIVLVSFVFSVFGMALPLSADDAKPHRGEFPQCQETCLIRHKAEMEALMTDYAHGLDNISFQDGIDKVLSRYKNCIDNCRTPMPVK